MSWDIFVQDIPRAARSAADIPDDFVPQPLCSRSRVVDAILAVAPFAKFSDKTFAQLDAPNINIAISIGADDPLRSFAFHIYGGERSAGVVADILDRLQLRGLDPSSESGIFDRSHAAGSFQRWQEFRTRVLQPRNT